MTNLSSVLKSKYIILPTKVNIVKSMFLPVVMYGYEITINNNNNNKKGLNAEELMALNCSAGEDS